MTAKEKALEYFNRKFHCSQAILAAYADKCGLSADLLEGIIQERESKELFMNP